MKIWIVLLLGIFMLALLAMPGVMTAPVKAQDAAITETPAPDQNGTVTETPVPTETPAPDQNGTVTETPVPPETAAQGESVTTAETPGPAETPVPTAQAPAAVPSATAAPAGITVTLDNNNLDFSNLHYGANEWSTGITVDTSYASWYVKITDDTGSPTPGYMAQTTNPSIHLESPLFIKSIDTSSYGTMSPSLVIWTGTSPGTFKNTFCAMQQIGPHDQGGLYSMRFALEGGAL
jgi:hypothetical protein